MKKLLIISLVLMFVFTGCEGCDSHHGVAVIIINETSHNVYYTEKQFGDDYNIKLPFGKKIRIYDGTDYGDEGLPVLGCFIFDDTLTLQYKPSDTFARTIYKNHEIEKPYDRKRNTQTNYYYTLTEEDYQNALRQSQR